MSNNILENINGTFNLEISGESIKDKLNSIEGIKNQLNEINTIKEDIKNIYAPASKEGEPASGILVNEITRVENLITTEQSRAEGIEANHEGRIVKMEKFWEGANSEETIDKLAEIVDYINRDESGAIEMAATIQSNVNAISCINDSIKTLDSQLSGYKTDLNGVKNQADTNSSRISSLEQSIENIDIDLPLEKGTGENSVQQRGAIASGSNSHAEGYNTFAVGNYSHAEGYGTGGATDVEASGEASHAENYQTKAIGNYSHAEGQGSQAKGSASHAEGFGTKAEGDYSHAEGKETKASKERAHAEGYGTEASGLSSHAEGHRTKALNTGAHSEGESTNAFGYCSHTEGYSTISKGRAAHAEGENCTTEGNYSHAEGHGTKALGQSSHAEGEQTVASGNYSHAQGFYTNALGECQSVFGRVNEQDEDQAMIIGNGRLNSSQMKLETSNAYTVDWYGNSNQPGAVGTSGADYAEYFEWFDSNPENEDRVGLLVTLEGNKIKLADNKDEVIGIVSCTAAVLGDSYESVWQGKYLVDEFGRTQYEMVEEFIKVPCIEEDENGEIIETIENRSIGFFKYPILNPNYDPEQTYIKRSKRPEWDTVGLFGKLYARDDGTAVINGYVTAGENGIATYSNEKTNMRVLSRVNNNIIRVLLK